MIEHNQRFLLDFIRLILTSERRMDDRIKVASSSETGSFVA